MSTNTAAESGPIATTSSLPPPSGPRPLVTAVRLGLAVAWSLVIMGLCWTPLRVVEEVKHGSRWFEIPNLDKLVHWGIFTVFTVLWLRVGISRRRFAAFALVALGGLALAVVTEVVQTHPWIGRSCELDDGITDMIGVAIGCALAPWVEPPLLWIEARLLGGDGAG